MIPADKLTGTPEISYPCLWEYKVFGEDCSLLIDAIKAACHPLTAEISHSNTSSSGRYHSMKARLTVPDEETRTAIFQHLQRASAVKFIL